MNKFVTCNCPVGKKTVPLVAIPLEIALYIFEVGEMYPQLFMNGRWEGAKFTIYEIFDDSRKKHNAVLLSGIRPYRDAVPKFEAYIFYDRSIDGEKSFAACAAMPLPCGKARNFNWAKVVIETNRHRYNQPFNVPKEWNDPMYSVCASFDERDEIAECGCKILHGKEGVKAFRMKYPNV